MKVIISGDHAGMTIRNEVKSLLEEMGIEYEDTGCSCETSVDYPDYLYQQPSVLRMESLTAGF